MDPTLKDGDYIFVSKVQYGPRLPRSLYEIPWLNQIQEIKIIYIGNKAITVVAMITTIAILAIVALSLYNLKKESADARIFNWKITGKVIADNSVNGVWIGFFGGNYGKKQANYYNYSNPLPQDINLFDCQPYAFNEYLHVTAEQGVIGLTLILIILYTAIKKHDRTIMFSNMDFSL